MDKDFLKLAHDIANGNILLGPGLICSEDLMLLDKTALVDEIVKSRDIINDLVDIYNLAQKQIKTTGQMVSISRDIIKETAMSPFIADDLRCALNEVIEIIDKTNL